MRSTLVTPLSIAALLLLSCDQAPTKAGIGSSCIGGNSCTSGICGGGHCLDPDQDSDGDKLLNRVEAAIGTDPAAADSDGDGKDDFAESDVNALTTPLDFDGDGVSDALESDRSDRDKDCIPDERDAQDDVRETDLDTVAEMACCCDGRCSDAGLTGITATCDAETGRLRCDGDVGGELLFPCVGGAVLEPCPDGCADDEICDDGTCVAVCNTTCAKAGWTCGEVCGESCGTCTGPQEACVSGTCECVPDCSDKVCGPDGCGGTCAPGCDADSECRDGACHVLCTDTCASLGWACGEVCGEACGTCPNTQDVCVDGACRCVPECGDRECGPDGCGGLCGAGCGAFAACQDGACVSTCTDTCTSEGWVCGEVCGESCGACSGLQEACASGHCICLPDCAGKQCGPNGCGGFCGPGCGAGVPCNAGVCDGSCDDTCLSTGAACGSVCGEACGACPGPQDTCIDNACVCIPECQNKVCGDDGCGGFCGPGCEPDEACNATGHCDCVPHCANRECGGDGCGGACLPGCLDSELCDSDGRCFLEGALDQPPTGEITAPIANSEVDGPVLVAVDASDDVALTELSLTVYHDHEVLDWAVAHPDAAATTWSHTFNVVGTPWEPGSYAIVLRLSDGIHPSVDADALVVVLGGGCVPQCDGRACGPDGCGGDCGTCPETQTCIAGGLCDDEMVYIPGGRFTMGHNGKVSVHRPDDVAGSSTTTFTVWSDTPWDNDHEVILSPYLIDKYEVSNAEFTAFLNESGLTYNTSPTQITQGVDGAFRPSWACQSSAAPSDTDPCDLQPAVTTHAGAAGYCSWRGKRLPTEAEWERAALGTTHALQAGAPARCTSGIACTNTTSSTSTGLDLFEPNDDFDTAIEVPVAATVRFIGWGQDSNDIDMFRVDGCPSGQARTVIVSAYSTTGAQVAIKVMPGAWWHDAAVSTSSRCRTAGSGPTYIQCDNTVDAPMYFIPAAHGRTAELVFESSCGTGQLDFQFTNENPFVIQTGTGGIRHDNSPRGFFPGDRSPDGVMDLAGNAAEHVADYYLDEYYAGSPLQDPTGPPTGSRFVVRGVALSSLYNGPYARWNVAGTALDGFRCAVSQACVPDCEGRVCGSDGCDGTCGPGCSEGQFCHSDGQCHASPEDMAPSGAITSPASFTSIDGPVTIDVTASDDVALSELALTVTHDGAVVATAMNQPASASATWSKVLNADGGGALSWAPGSYVVTLSVSDGVHPPEDVDAITLIVAGYCTPQCAGRVCGPDRCGGSCGTCPETKTCIAGGQCDDEMAYIAGGQFAMGAPDAVAVQVPANDGGTTTEWVPMPAPTAHPVILSPYLIDRFEVSVEEFVAFLNATGMSFPVSSSQIVQQDDGTYRALWTCQASPSSGMSQPCDLHPVSTTWSGAAAFCSFHGKRLPTEAQWERAALGAEHGIQAIDLDRCDREADACFNVRSQYATGVDRFEPNDDYADAISVPVAATVRFLDWGVDQGDIDVFRVESCPDGQTRTVTIKAYTSTGTQSEVVLKSGIWLEEPTRATINRGCTHVNDSPDYVRCSGPPDAPSYFILETHPSTVDLVFESTCGIGTLEIQFSNPNPFLVQENTSWLRNTSPRGLFPGDRSPDGVMDTLGNAAEMVSDYYAADYFDYSPLVDPAGPTTGTDRVLRGYIYSSYPYPYRRNHVSATALDGFRCATPQTCVPDCAGRACGPDGCGGACGDGCADGMYCDGAGQCAGAPVDTAPSGAITAPASYTTIEGAVAIDVSTTDDVALSELTLTVYSDDAVVAWANDAPSGATASWTHTFNAPGDPDSPWLPGAYTVVLTVDDGVHAVSEADTIVLIVADHCEPQCDGRACGPDSCGGTCGTCSESQTCVVGGVCDDAMVYIAGGDFTMGYDGELDVTVPSDYEGPTSIVRSMGTASYEHPVTLSPYLIDKYEVSVADFVAFLNGQGQGLAFSSDQIILLESGEYVPRWACQTDPDGPDDRPCDLHPVITSGSVAAAYCESVGKRLPTEAEWERAAVGPDHAMAGVDVTRCESWPYACANYEGTSGDSRYAPNDTFQSAFAVPHLAKTTLRGYYAGQDVLRVDVCPGGKVTFTRTQPNGHWSHFESAAAWQLSSVNVRCYTGTPSGSSQKKVFCVNTTGATEAAYFAPVYGQYGDLTIESDCWGGESTLPFRRTDPYAKTSPRGAFAPDASPEGVFDMNGNLSEVVGDAYAADYYENSPVFDPTGPEAATSPNVKRGDADALLAGPKSLYARAPAGTATAYGFRCAVPSGP